MKLISLTEFKQMYTSAEYPVGTVVQAKSSVVGIVTGIFVKFREAIAIQGGPCYLYHATGVPDGSVMYDENGTGSMGQHGCLGAAAYPGVVTISTYGFVQQYGVTTASLAFNGDCAVDSLIFPSTTDGQWVPVTTVSVAVNVTAATVVYNISPFGFVMANDGNTLNVLAAAMAFLHVPTRMGGDSL